MARTAETTKAETVAELAQWARDVGMDDCEAGRRFTEVAGKEDDREAWRAYTSTAVLDLQDDSGQVSIFPDQSASFNDGYLTILYRDWRDLLPEDDEARRMLEVQAEMYGFANVRILIIDGDVQP